MNLFTATNFLYWIVLVLVIFLETLTLGVIWKRREAARWVTGYVTVFVLGLPLVLLGEWDAATFTALFVAVGLSGAIKVGVQQYADARRADSLRRHGVDHPDVRQKYPQD